MASKWHRSSSQLQYAWFHAHPGYRSLLNVIWIFHKGNCFVYCYWINVSMGGRRAWGFPFCHLADVPENNLRNSIWFTYDGESILVRYFIFSSVTFIYLRLETLGGNSWLSKLWSRSCKWFLKKNFLWASETWRLRLN